MLNQTDINLFYLSLEKVPSILDVLLERIWHDDKFVLDPSLLPSKTISTSFGEMEIEYTKFKTNRYTLIYFKTPNHCVLCTQTNRKIIKCLPSQSR
jgi:hypothetical protein